MALPRMSVWMSCARAWREERERRVSPNQHGVNRERERTCVPGSRARGVIWCEQSGERGKGRTGTGLTLVGVRDLQIRDVAPDVVPSARAHAHTHGVQPSSKKKSQTQTSRDSLVRARVATEHVQQHPALLERLAAVIALHERHHLRRPAPRVLEPPDLQARVQPERGLRLRADELPLHELERRERAPELRPLARVRAGAVQAVLERADHAERDAEPAGTRTRRVSDER